MSALTIDFTQLAADGSTAKTNIPTDGNYSLFAFGAFGGGTLTFEASPDGGVTWLSVASFTASGRSSHYLSNGEELRATLAGSLTPTVDSSVR